MTSRNYCFTLNNPDQLIDFETSDNVKYAIYSEEIGDNGNYHFQGYIELKRPVRYTSIVKSIPELRGAHFEPRRGTPDQARAYCMKTDDPTFIAGPYEYGEFTGQGARTDWMALKKDLDAHKTEQEIADNHFSLYMRYAKGIDRYRLLRSPSRNFKTEVIFLYGPPGTGKSSFIQAAEPDCYWKSRSNWWDGYSGQTAVAIDDFYGWLPYDLMLRAMDRYPLSVEIKGATVNFAPKRLYITSNRLPHEWWDTTKVPFNHGAFYRRIDKIIYMPALNEKEEYTGELADFHIKFGTLSRLV